VLRFPQEKNAPSSSLPIGLLIVHLSLCFLLQLFVGGMDMHINEEHLKRVFTMYGELVSVMIPAGKSAP
jgi:hypothetical protein